MGRLSSLVGKLSAQVGQFFSTKSCKVCTKSCKVFDSERPSGSARFGRTTEPSVFTEPEPELIAICKFAVMEDSIFDFFEFPL